MNIFSRRWGRASALLIGAVGASIAAGSFAGACALPGYTLGENATGSGGAGGASAGAGGKASTTVGSGGAGGQATGGGGAIGSGGAGGAPNKPCLSAADCGPDPEPCQASECTGGQCVITPRDGELPPGGDLNPTGDCNKAICMAGHLKYMPDPADKPLGDPKICHQNTCVNSYIDQSPLAIGTSCQADPNSQPGLCDMFGKCVECSMAAGACAVCVDGKCYGDACANLQKDMGESDIDCGGPCAPCPPGKKCTAPTDCQAGVCDVGNCVTPNYADGVKNGPETGVDCGGPAPNACVPGQGCIKATDCVSGVCKKGVCQFTCGNNIQDGLEVGVDCGGPGCKMVACP